MWSWLVAAFVLVGCVARHETFPCDDTSQCVRGERAGTCEVTGYCSFADPACASGWRYAEESPELYAGKCTTELEPGDAAPDVVDGSPASCLGGDDRMVSARGRCFSRHDTDTDALGAAAVCAELGRMVATFADQDEELEVEAALLDGPRHSYYINLQDLVSEGDYRWADGRALTYTNWHDDEPNDDEVGVAEDYVALRSYTSEPYGWADVAAAFTAGVICASPVLERAPDGERYTFVYGLMNQVVAARACSQAGATLATETSFSESGFVAARARHFSLWNGAGDHDVEGTYAWDSGVPWAFTDWSQGEPTDALGPPPEGTGGVEDCVFHWSGGDGRWADAPCAEPSVNAGAACDEGR